MQPRDSELLTNEPSPPIKRIDWRKEDLEKQDENSSPTCSNDNRQENDQAWTRCNWLCLHGRDQIGSGVIYPFRNNRVYMYLNYCEKCHTI